MPLLDVRTLEKTLQYYLDHMHFDVLWLVILSDTQFAQRHKLLSSVTCRMPVLKRHIFF